MNQLFISLYLDEDVDVLVASLLRARGVQVTTTRDADQLHRSDSEQLVYATRHRMALVTHNLSDFESLARSYFTNGQAHTGIIIAFRNPPQIIAARLMRLVNQVTADEIENQLRYI
jgi:predicted nuclease of predicted toxin-antitoxin system